MEFGKVPLELLHTIDFTLPPDDPRSKLAHVGEGAPQALPVSAKRATDPARALIRIGCPVWGSPAWLGTLYPVGTPAKEFLEHYARQINTIELNTTHYRIPDLATIERWRKLTPSGFTFCPKFPQAISHRHPLGQDRGLVKSFLTSVLSLGDRLGTTFLQLPPTFAPRDLPELRNLLQDLNSIQSPFPIAIEVRHPGFFSDHRLHELFFETLAEFQAGSVITDVSGRRDVLHTSLPVSRAFIRFIGNGGDPSDEFRLNQWVERLASWVNSGIEDIQFFVHQPDDIAAPKTIANLIDALNAKTGLQIKKWSIANQGTQMGFF